MLISPLPVDVYRLTPASGKDRYPGSPLYEGVEISVMPAGAELQMMYPSSTQFAQFQIFTMDLREFKTGDKFVAEDGREWILHHIPERFAYSIGLDYQWFMGEQVP